VNANVPEVKPQNTELDPATQEKIREFCFGLALALRRITGRKIDQGIEELPEMIGDAIEAANGTEFTVQPRRSKE
jgi:hypothetical protein